MQQAVSVHNALSRAVVLLTLVSFSTLGSPTKDRLGRLTEELESTETSNQAAQTLLRLGKADPKVRAYLAENLPTIISKGPPRLGPWTNAVSLAAGLKIAQCSRALVKWISARPGSGTTTLGQTARLEDQPAAKALAQIGNPVIPDVVTVLRGGALSERWTAAFVLDNIGSPPAKKALKDHLSHETDPSLRAFIRRALGTG